MKKEAKLSFHKVMTGVKFELRSNVSQWCLNTMRDELFLTEQGNIYDLF